LSWHRFEGNQAVPPGLHVARNRRAARSLSDFVVMGSHITLTSGAIHRMVCLRWYASDLPKLQESHARSLGLVRRQSIQFVPSSRLRSAGGRVREEAFPRHQIAARAPSPTLPASGEGEKKAVNHVNRSDNSRDGPSADFQNGYAHALRVATTSPPTWMKPPIPAVQAPLRGRGGGCQARCVLPGPREIGWARLRLPLA